METKDVITEAIYMEDCYTAEESELEAVMEGLEDLDNGRVTDADVFLTI